MGRQFCRHVKKFWCHEKIRVQKLPEQIDPFQHMHKAREFPQDVHSYVSLSTLWPSNYIA